MADAPLPVPQDHSAPESHVLKPLNERQREFCKHYVMTKGNVLQSAILAGYAAGHGNTAHAYRLPDMPHVQAGIAYYRELFGAQVGYDRDKLLYELGLMASVDVTEMVDDDWQVIPKSKLSKEHRQAMVGLEVIQKSDSRTIRPRYAKLEAKKEIAELLGLKQHDKKEGQGLSLQITLGQSVSVDGVAQTQHVGHLQITTHTPTAEDAPEA